MKSSIGFLTLMGVSLMFQTGSGEPNYPPSSQSLLRSSESYGYRSPVGAQSLRSPLSSISEPSLGRKCPFNFPLLVDGGLCAREVPSTKRCPGGFVAQAGRCVRSYQPRLSCPQDAFPNRDGSTTCVREHVGSPSCPSGYFISEFGDSCTMIVPKVFSSCSDGFRPSVDKEDVCVKVEDSPVKIECLPGQGSLQSDGVSCKKTTPVSPRCPDGFDPITGNEEECRRQKSRVTKCPEDYVVVRDSKSDSATCRKTTYSEKVAECSPGFSLSKDKCAKVSWVPSHYRCPKDTKGRPVAAESDAVECYRRTVTLPRLSCPEGFELAYNARTKVSKCLRTTTEECSRTVLEKRCSPNLPPPSPQLLAGVVPLSPVGTAGGNTKGLHCVSVPVEVSFPCVKEQQIDPEPICLDGIPDETSILPDSKIPTRCISDEIVEKERYCREEKGEFDDGEGRCFRIDAEAIKFVCPNETKEVNQRCETVIEMSGTLVCPSLFDEDPKYPAGDCQQRIPIQKFDPEITFSDAARLCVAEGSVPSHDGSKEVCRVVKSETRTRVCPLGTVQESRLEIVPIMERGHGGEVPQNQTSDSHSRAVEEEQIESDSKEIAQAEATDSSAEGIHSGNSSVPSVLESEDSVVEVAVENSEVTESPVTRQPNQPSKNNEEETGKAADVVSAEGVLESVEDKQESQISSPKVSEMETTTSTKTEEQESRPSDASSGEPPLIEFLGEPLYQQRTPAATPSTSESEHLNPSTRISHVCVEHTMLLPGPVSAVVLPARLICADGHNVHRNPHNGPQCIEEAAPVVVGCPPGSVPHDEYLDEFVPFRCLVVHPVQSSGAGLRRSSPISTSSFQHLD